MTQPHAASSLMSTSLLLWPRSRAAASMISMQWPLSSNCIFHVFAIIAVVVVTVLAAAGVPAAEAAPLAACWHQYDE